MELKVVNLSYIKEVCGESNEIMIEMIEIFCDQIAEFNQEMKSLLSDGSYHELGLLAHKAKSSVAIMGMDHLAELLKQLEINAKEGIDTDTYKQYINEFESQTRDAISELDIFVKSLE